MAVLRTYGASTAALSPLAQWRFDEPGGATLVDSAAGLDGVYQGAVAFGARGTAGHGADLLTGGADADRCAGGTIGDGAARFDAGSGRAWSAPH